jgi:hypothetical protein
MDPRRLVKLRKALPRREASMDYSIRAMAESNILHFRRLLVFETDNANRRTICELLAEEEAKMDTLVPVEGKV